MPDYSSLDIPRYVYEVPSDYEVYLEYGEHFDFAKKQLYRNYLKTLLSERQNHKCCYCGLVVTDVPNSRRQSTTEHVIPQSRGGKWDLWNCVIACSKCNRRRGNNELEEEKMVMLGLTDDEQFVIPYMRCDSGVD